MVQVDAHVAQCTRLEDGPNARVRVVYRTTQALAEASPLPDVGRVVALKDLRREVRLPHDDTLFRAIDAPHGRVVPALVEL